VFKAVIFVLLTLSTLFSREITLKELNSYPKSVAKDFYIWLYLQQKSTTEWGAKQAYKGVHRKSSKIKRAYKKKVKKVVSKPTKVDKCSSIPLKKLSTHKNLKCVAKSLTAIKAIMLKPHEQRDLLKKMIGVDKDKELLLKAVYYAQPVEKTLYSRPQIYLDLFFWGTKSYRHGKRINTDLSISFINRLTENKHRFTKFVRNVLAYDVYKPLQKALLKVQPSDKIDVDVLFDLAFHLIANNHITKAKKFLKQAKKSATYQPHIDKAVFWLHLLTGRGDYLSQLNRSWDINMYTLYAKEKLGKDIDNVLSHYNFTDYSPLFKPQMNPSSPFDWHKTKKEISRLQKGEKAEDNLLNFASLFKTSEHIGIHSYIMERAHKFRKQSFPMPYRDVLEDLSIKDKATIYALARQESRFIPGSISISYALGMMQIMPFLVKDIAKRKGEKIDLEEMFNPRKNLQYAKFHLKDLKKQFKSPILIAYAYNGGGGFTRRMLKGGELFVKGKYEPFLSMERVSYRESRLYAKKVLANYVVYRKLLGSPVSISELIDNLLIPKKSDYIRK
jgi:soluble lytic murein transglycosylase